MARPPHIHIAGHIYYITTVVHGRLPLFIRPSFVIPLLDSLNFYRFKSSFRLLAYVIMPDHMHLIIWPYGVDTPDVIMRDYKKYTAVRLIRQAELESRGDLLEAFKQAGSDTGRSDKKVWQDSYWDTNVFSAEVLKQKIDYLHANPLRKGLVAHPEDYPYSSYRNYVCADHSLIEVDCDWLPL